MKDVRNHIPMGEVYLLVYNIDEPFHFLDLNSFNVSFLNYNVRFG